MQTLPKVKFTLATLDEVFPILYWFLTPSKKRWDWSDRIYEEYPLLKRELEGIKGRQVRKEKEYEFFKRRFEKNCKFYVPPKRLFMLLTTFFAKPLSRLA